MVENPFNLMLNKYSQRTTNRIVYCNPITRKTKDICFISSMLNLHRRIGSIFNLDSRASSNTNIDTHLECNEV